MATSNGTGAPARLNPPQERPQSGDTGQERAWLAGLAWLNGLTPAERAAALITVATPATSGAEATPSRACPTKVKVDHDDAEFGYSWFAALTPDQRGACIDWFNSQAAPATRSNDAPASTPEGEWTPAAERVSVAREALYQAVQIADLLIGELGKSRDDETPLHLGLTVRVRDLVDAADLLLTNPDCCDEEDAIPQASRTIFGPGHRPRATAGAAS